ncbi:MAG TPA: alpha/beta fold hydrolase [Acidimicrobiales bacterium]|nr:alpha/beta fold hydrolase [Acidimicrobiales bacterium]
MSERPVLFVHGFATSAERTWREPGWLDLVADAGRPTIAPDLLGHGTASHPHDPAAYEHLEQGLLDALPDEPVDAIGFSLGARTLLVAAAAHPERFHRLVVAGVGSNLFRDEGGETIAAAIEGPDDPEHPVAQHFRQLAHQPGNDPVALAACMRRPARPLTADDLARVTLPVLVVVGDQDFVLPVEPLVEALPDATLVTLRHVDHFGTPKSMTFIDEALAFVDARPF